MIGKISGYTILLINHKYDVKVSFAENAAKLSGRPDDESLLKTGIASRQAQVYGVYYEGDLQAWYLVQKKEHALTLTDSYVSKKIPHMKQDLIEKEILKELVSQCFFKHCSQLIWKERTLAVNPAPIIKSTLLGVLFGIVMGFIFGFFTSNQVVGIAIAITWGIAMAYVFGAHELRTIQDTVD